jgi:tetratricopeptide (TPR) repeat protein
MNELVTGLVPGIPDGAAAMICDKAAGVPMYAVELVRKLVADGVLVRQDGDFRLIGELKELAVPESLHSVIGSRLDGLDPDDRSLLQDAAVLGHAFTLEGLMALRREGPASLETRLRGLVKKDVLELEDDPRSPERGQYRFVQSLIREVAYGRLAKPERRARHLAVARFIESRDDLELAPVVASHYLSAHQATARGAEADDLQAKACGALRNAARRAADLHSHQQALTLVDQALAITSDPVEQAGLWELAARSANLLVRVDDAIGHARRALDVYRRGADGPATFRAATLLATILSDHSRPLEAVKVLEPILDGQPEPAAPTLMAMNAALARAHMLSGEDSASAAIAERALVPAELVEDMPVLVDALITRGSALGNLGRVKEGSALLKGAIDLAEAYQLPRVALRAINNLLVVLSADDRQDASRMLKAGLEQARRIDDRFWTLRFAGWVAMYLVDEGQFDEALALLNEFDLAEMDRLDAAQFRWGIARVGQLRGDVAALDPAVEATVLFIDDADPQTAAIGQWMRVDVAWLAGEFAEACDRALRIDHGFIGNGDHLYLAAQAALRLGDADRVEEITKVVSGLPMRGRMIRGLERLLSAGRAALSGDREQAMAGFRELLNTWAPVASPLQLAETQALFAALVGQDDPEAKAAAEAAYQWVISAGATRLLTLWAAGLPHPQAVAATG